MTERVDFYVLDGKAPRERLAFACRLAEKAYLRDMSVVMLGETGADAEALDDLLWTFSERSFVPHELRRSAPIEPQPRPAPVQVTADLDCVDVADLLVNLSPRLPGGMARFKRIAEVIDGDDDRRRLGRERFKAYRDLKLAVETHRLDEA
jgi:DNA polymerase-3 subunit chi